MIIRIADPTQNSYNLLRQCGYAVFRDPNTGKTSYTKRLDRDYYPRFHIYMNKESEGELELNLHLDQKHASYKGQTAHSGEYDGDLVEREAERIESLVNQVIHETAEKPKKGFFTKLFGK
ncbi:hypothetical protein KKD19_06735 [Patescibacteria group bacterium]|nr:hypothetical protein [Patescibacteria group bacterium]MBU4512899.1 hypothetical protein [Patescibacteria group bacterium]MCG2692611.1 hypothetical protein [Candidatus Parcubacteria bacterium]